MKKFYLFALCLGTAFGSVYAQSNRTSENLFVTKTKQPFSKPLSSVQSVSSEEKAIIWTNDFGTPSDWTFTDNAGSGDNWVIGTGVPSGAYAIAGIASTTVANGFALYDSDLMCSGSQNADVTIVNPVDASAYGAVAVQFESYYRKYVGAVYVIASNDGVTWTEYEVHTSLATNDASANPEVVTIDVSPTIANSATAYIGFRYIGGCDYAWMVDDVALVETPNNSLQLTDAWWTNTPASATPWIPYSKMPQNQLNDINFFGTVLNAGGVDQPNCAMTVTLSGSGSGTYTSTSYTSLAGTGVQDTLSAGPLAASGLTNGSYAVAWSVNSDSTDTDPTDNVIDSVWDFEVTNNLYARDQGVYSGAYNTQDFDADGLIDPVEFFLDYQFYNSDTVYSIAAVFPGGTRNTAGLEVKYNIYDPAGNAVFDGVTAPVPTYTLTAADLTAGAGSEVWVELPLTDPLTGGAGFPIDAALGQVWTFSIFNEFDSLFVGVSGDAPAVGGSWTTAGISWYPLDGSNQAYYTTDCFMMRLNVTGAASTGISENSTSVNLGQNRPNPFNDNTVIPFTLSNAGNVAFTVTDVTGKVIENRNLGVLGAGSQNIEFNGSNLASGIYYYTLTVDAKRSTKKFIIE
ncbi:MAG TPA: hypothetical protein DCF89_04195 [Flavobacteriales bacterium]|nr:hypothetical protein [Crocinitomicaceae bacterium]HAE30295.1 hypothetical protein [Flavobacteriales bacterium]|tara:strand:+ start:1036 stop:2919 length:1884 start_codon:yes stop_codon:yes gene_type:complete